MIFPVLSLVKLAKDIRSRPKKDSDAVLCISGFEGVGKSTLAKILGFLLDPDFDLWDNVLYSPSKKELLGKLKVLSKGNVLDLDEAVKVLEKQEWSKQTFIKKTYQVIRGRNLITMLLIPRLEDLNEYFRNWRVMLNICVIYRGLAYLQVPDPYNKFDVWNTKYNQAKLDAVLRDETFHTAPVPDVLGAISQFKGFIGFITFPKLPKEIWKVYKKYKDEHSLLNLSEEGDEKDKGGLSSKKEQVLEENTNALRLAVVRLKEDGYTLRRIADELGISMGKVRSLRGDFS